jgi:predicted RNase H-like HicB family nuclease
MEKTEKNIKIMAKPLPQILDEMDDNIRKADEYCKRAEEAARQAREAADISISVSQEVLKEKSKSTKGCLVVFEKAKSNYSAYSPDLPGCIATGKTRQEAEKNIREAIKFHVEGLKEDGLNLPEPSSDATYIEV